MVLSHIPSLLKWSGTYFKERGSMCTAFSHIFCVFRWSGVSLIHIGVEDVDMPMFIYTFMLGEVKIYPEVVIFVSDKFKNNNPRPLLVFWHAPIHHAIRMPGNGWKLLLNLCFLSLAFLMAFVPLDNLTIIAIFIVITSTCLFVLGSKASLGQTVKNKGFPHHIITYFWCFKVIRYIA